MVSQIDLTTLSSDYITITRSQITKVINDCSWKFILPILRDIRLCRLFGSEKKLYELFYAAKSNDTLYYLNKTAKAKEKKDSGTDRPTESNVKNGGKKENLSQYANDPTKFSTVNKKSITQNTTEVLHIYIYTHLLTV